MSEEKHTLSIVEINKGDDKTIIDLELSDEIVKWFKANRCSSRRWNSTEFKKWFKDILCKAWITLEAGEYKVIYRAQPPYGNNTPKKGDVVSFFRNGFRTRVVAEVTKKTIKLAPLWDGDSHGRINLSDITDIIRPRKRLSPTPPMYEPEEAGD
jgi:hypothetical protein